MNIDHLVLNGFQPQEAKGLSEALQSQLSQLLLDPVVRAEWARSHRTPVLKLGSMPLEAGTAGARRFGRQVARALGRGLKS